jgi:predicted transcriptional regulator
MTVHKKGVRAYRDEVLQELFRKNFGIQTKIANLLGVSRACISTWKHVPIKHLKKVSQFTKIPRKKLRPDLYD